MLKMIIVEDELLMRNFLKNCLDYNDIDIEIFGDFCDAEEALEVIKNENIDIVVTDIKMPGMDGITFMSRVLEFNTQIRLLVVSNYQEFEVVRRALQMGVCDYISKTNFEIEEYRRILLGIAEGIKKSVVTRKVESEGKLKEIFWSGEPSGASLKVTTDAVSLAVADILNYDEIMYSDKKIMKQKLSEYLLEIKLAKGRLDFFFDIDNLIIILFSSVNFEEMSEMLKQFESFVKEQFNLKLCLFMSNQYFKFAELKSEYIELYTLKKMRFFLKENQIITVNILREYNDEFNYTDAMKKCESMFNNGNFSEIADFLKKMSGLHPAQIYLNKLHAFYWNVYLMIENYATISGIDISFIDDFDKLFKTSNVDEVTEKFCKAVMIFQEAKTEVNDSSKMKLQMIDDYIDKHYFEQLTLKNVAELFNYEYNYFSKLFYKLKGMTFKKYLIEVRMSEAMKLIQNTDLKCSVISTRVGYKNYEHFSRSFREKYGCWPNEVERENTNG